MILDGIRRFDPVTGEIEFVPLKADLHRTSVVRRTLERVSRNEDVERFDWIEVDEDLDIAGAEAPRFTGLPILDGERSWSSADVAGIVTGMRLEEDAIVCTGKISSKVLVADIAAGRPPAVSLGYVRKSEEFAWRKGDVPFLRVRRWEPVEVSFLPQTKAA